MLLDISISFCLETHSFKCIEAFWFFAGHVVENGSAHEFEYSVRASESRSIGILRRCSGVVAYC